MKRSAGILVALSLVLSACGSKPVANKDAANAGSSGPKEKVLIRFTWKMKGEYAPLYVALDKGHYAAEGLDVELAEGSGAQTVLKVIGSDQEHFGYGPAVAAAQATTQGIPVTVAALWQTATPMGVISFPDKAVKTPKELEGKSIATSVGETFTDMLEPFTKKNSVDVNKIQRIQMDSAARATQFLSKKVDVMSVYLSNELPDMEKKAGVKFAVMKVADYGFELPGASLYVNSDYAKLKPDIVAKVIRATNKGYADAMKNPQEAATIMNKYMTVKVDADVMLAQVKATVESTNAPQGKPIGWQDDAYWKKSLDLMKETGAIKEIKDLKLYFTNDLNK